MIVINELDSLMIRLEIQADDLSQMTTEPSSADAGLSRQIPLLENRVLSDGHDRKPTASPISNIEEDDESPLAYARRRGLTLDYLQHDPKDSMREFVQRFHETHRDFEDPPGSFSPPKEFELKERLTIDMEAAQLLQEVLITPDLPKEFGCEFEEEPPNSRTRPKLEDLKVEIPLLRTDNELDMLRFGRLPKPDFGQLSKFPLIPENDEDEWLEYESKLLDAFERIRKALEAEKLEIPKEALDFLQSVIQEDYDSTDEESLASEVHWSMSKRFEDDEEFYLEPLKISDSQEKPAGEGREESGLAEDNEQESETAEGSNAIQRPKQRSALVPAAAANESQGSKGLRGIEKSFTSDLGHKTYISQVLDGTFSVSTTLAAFMQGQGIKVAEQSVNYIVDPAHKPHIEPPLNITNLPRPAGDALESNAETQRVTSLPVPILPSPLPKTTIILSSTLFSTQRTLIKELKYLYADLSFIERDFSTVKPPLCNEADIIASPSSGLVLTTIQKIKQKPLPGQESFYYGIKEHLINLSIRYERLVILVAEGSSISNAARDLDDSDCLALSEMMGFAAALDADAQVVYVPGGSKELAIWTAYCVARFRFGSASSIGRNGWGGDGQQVPRLIEDETLWEQALRRAGLNAFAAQVVLAELKEPDGPCPSRGLDISSLASGSTADTFLRAFVRMAPEERIRRFEMLLGGRRVLTRVNKALEQQWLSSNDAFRTFLGR